MTHRTLLTALLGSKAVQRERKEPIDGNTFRELIQFDEFDQLVNYWYHPQLEGWTKNEEEIFSLISFLTEEPELYNFYIVDKINMEGKLSIRDIIQALISDDAAVQIESMKDGNLSYVLMQLTNDQITAFEPNKESQWEEGSSLTTEQEEGEENNWERYYIVPALKS